MTTTSIHDSFVSDWLDARLGEGEVGAGAVRSRSRDRDRARSGSGSGSGATAARVADLLVAALRAVWSRSRSTLGDVTLGALLKNVLETVVREHPILQRAGLRLDDRQVVVMDVSAFEHEAAARDLLLVATRRLLVELLSVFGQLTAEALTPGLHEAVTSIATGSITTSTSTSTSSRDRESHERPVYGH
jgi:hypothetical protein